MVSKEPFSGITIVGLGPGDPALLTRQAWEWIQTTPSLVLRTRHHPVVAGFPKSLLVESFDEIYDRSENYEQVFSTIVERVLELGRQPNGVTYAVPGHPYVAEATTPEIVRRARAEGISVRVFEGLSVLEPSFTSLGLDPFPNTVLVDALDVAAGHMPLFPPNAPALICQIHSREVAAQVKMVLMEVYPVQHPVALIHGAGTDQQIVENIPLYEIDRSHKIGLLSTLYLPALGPDTAFEAFQELVAHLRAPEGCPWDQKQTHLSLRTHLL
ncbi:MAG TPA: SAM-dependent methyltransferase, partial [Anaerolineaceae bacterium]|nr:SAM-dependent methyltransferase [Anaerolineaceae bacterium]